MSLPSSEHNENKPESGREAERDEAKRNFADGGADATPGSPVSIIPVAPMHWRMLAFLLDGILISLFAFLLLIKVLLPEYHPVGYSQFHTLMSEHMEAARQAQAEGKSVSFTPDPAAQTEEIQAMFTYGVEIFALCVVIYFVLCERFMAGGSIGKSMFRLRVISLNSGRPPSIWESFLRGLIKSCPLVVWPFFICYFFPFFNRMRRAGHDMLARTLVVSDIGGTVPYVAPPRRRRNEEED